LTRNTLPLPNQKVIKWEYGVTTVPARLPTTFPLTLKSLKAAGFPSPRLFVDGCSQAQEEQYRAAYNGPISIHRDRIRTAGNWILSLAELYLREPDADRYAIFQDDTLFPLNLREYLNRCQYPQKGYLNLYVFPPYAVFIRRKLGLQKTSEIPRGIYPTPNRGLSACALVFDRSTVVRVLGGDIHLWDRATHPTRGHCVIDGGIVTTLKNQDFAEYVHYPSLVQHQSDVPSETSEHTQPLAIGFLGEEHNCGIWVKGAPVVSFEPKPNREDDPRLVRGGKNRRNRG